MPSAPPGVPVGPPEGVILANHAGDPPAWLQAREERAAILEYEGGLTRAEAEAEAARLHPEPEI